MINVYKVENVGCLSFLKILKFKHSTTSTQFLKSDTTKFLMIIPTIWITELTYCQHSPAAFHLSGCVEISLFLSSLLFQGDYDILLLYDSLGGGQLGSGRSELSALDLVFLTPHFIQEVLILLGLQQTECLLLCVQGQDNCGVLPCWTVSLGVRRWTVACSARRVWEDHGVVGLGSVTPWRTESRTECLGLSPGLHNASPLASLLPRLPSDHCGPTS